MRYSAQLHLSRRERQVMDVIYRFRTATATEVLERIPDPPSYSALRAMLRVLEAKSYVKQEQETFLPTPVWIAACQLTLRQAL